MSALLPIMMWLTGAVFIWVLLGPVLGNSHAGHRALPFAALGWPIWALLAGAIALVALIVRWIGQVRR